MNLLIWCNPIIAKSTSFSCSFSWWWGRRWDCATLLDLNLVNFVSILYVYRSRNHLTINTLLFIGCGCLNLCPKNCHRSNLAKFKYVLSHFGRASLFETFLFKLIWDGFYFWCCTLTGIHQTYCSIFPYIQKIEYLGIVFETVIAIQAASTT